jgi:hypothetical protein
MIEFFLNYSTKKKFVWIEKREEVNAPSRKEISLVLFVLSSTHGHANTLRDPPADTYGPPCRSVTMQVGTM